ncbi:MAG TPA: hypothetical protein VNN25_19080 [Thermoanaerobaculia bacterium]|nr:hypothetical protein [Thermoanaerobaculia bacterium]
MKQPTQRPLTEDEIDEIVISQAYDDDAWEEEFEVTPISRPRARDANPPVKHPAGRPQQR